MIGVKIRFSLARMKNPRHITSTTLTKKFIVSHDVKCMEDRVWNVHLKHDVVQPWVPCLHLQPAQKFKPKATLCLPAQNPPILLEIREPIIFLQA